MFKDSCRMLPATTTFELQCLLLRHQVLMSFAAISCFVSHKDERLKVKYPGDPCRTCPTTVCYKAIQGSDFADCWKYRETVEGTGHSASTSRTSCWNRRRKAHPTHFFARTQWIYWFIDFFIDIHWYSFRIIQNVLFRHFILRSPQDMSKYGQGSTCHDSWHVFFCQSCVFVTLPQVWPAPSQSKTLLLLGQVPEKSHVGFVQKLEYTEYTIKLLSCEICEPELFPGKTKTQSWGGKSASGGNAIAYRNLWPV